MSNSPQCIYCHEDVCQPGNGDPFVVSGDGFAYHKRCYEVQPALRWAEMQNAKREAVKAAIDVLWESHRYLYDYAPVDDKCRDLRRRMRDTIEKLEEVQKI